MVVSIQTISSPNGCHTTIATGHKAVTVDGVFQENGHPIRTADYATNYMYGT
ncbi:MAG TPA: hypothetical protein VFN56_01285 [Candidatus Saccharimonadales bacterium]|nr:hypothetical protein [Candidatus Saccharimonadales bacterium]